MDFNAEIILEDVRVKLSPLSKQATKHLLQYSLNEPETWTYSLQQPNSEVALETYIQTALQAKKEEKAYPFIVTDKFSFKPAQIA